MRRAVLMVSLLAFGVFSAPAAAMAIAEYSGNLLLGIDYYEDYYGCRFRSRCADMTDIGLHDIDIRDGLARAPPGVQVRFDLGDTGDYHGAQFSEWKVCQYNQYDQLLQCAFGQQNGAFGRVHPDTTGMRVILLQGVAREYTMFLWHF